MTQNKTMNRKDSQPEFTAITSLITINKKALQLPMNKSALSKLYAKAL